MQHLDEGTIHAWLDGELPADEAEKMAAHANECPECGALVAEARGLIAASTRILTALDDVPAGVVPSGSGIPEKTAVPGGPGFRRPWYSRTDFRAAAALLFVAGASLVAVKAARNPGQSLKSEAMTASSADRASALLQDSGAPVGADVVQQEKASEVKPMVGKAIAPVAPAERRRSEGQVAASPPALSSKVALREPAAAPASAMANAMDAVSDLNAMSKLRSDAPVSGRVQGQVMDRAKGKGLPAVNVIVEGTKLGATTDEEGRFTIDSVPAGDRRLTARRIGYMAQTVPLAVKEETGATATVTLAPATTTLEEMIVSGVATGATAKAATTPLLRVVKVDSTGTNRSVVYEVSPGVQVTLVEAPLNIAAEKDQIANKRVMQRTRDSSALAGSVSGATLRANAAKTDREAAAAPAPAPMVMNAAAPPPINTISWSDQNRRYTLSGPLKLAELEAIKARLMKMRR